MDLRSIEADYLIVGSGAVGMAFADVILTETNDRRPDHPAPTITTSYTSLTLFTIDFLR
jgi:hypothetical protein